MEIHNWPAQFELTLSWQGNSEISRMILLYMCMLCHPKTIGLHSIIAEPKSSLLKLPISVVC